MTDFARIGQVESESGAFIGASDAPTSATASSIRADANAGKPKVDGYANLIQAKRLADAMVGVVRARAALDVLAKVP